MADEVYFALSQILLVSRWHLPVEQQRLVDEALNVISAELRRLSRVPALHRASVDGFVDDVSLTRRKICLGCGGDWPCKTVTDLVEEQA